MKELYTIVSFKNGCNSQGIYSRGKITSGNSCHLIQDSLKMISEKDKEIIIKYSTKYNVSYVILFGSSTRKDRESNDIDIGVKGIEPGLFF